MTLSAETLPDDPETLKAMLIAERIRSERLAQIIKDMNRHRFGRRAEALPADQLLLGLEEAEQNEAEAAAEAEAKSPPMREEAKRKRRANRGALPSHLPEIETTVDVETKACPCCGGHLHCIGEEVSKKLDIIPAQFRVLVVRRPKYACRACEDVVIQAPAPARVIEGGLPTEALVAHVLVSKYADHLPLYRQAQIYERQGLHLDRSTLADWVGRAAFLLRPLRDRILELLRSSTKLFADETTAPVLDPGRGRTKTGPALGVWHETIDPGAARGRRRSPMFMRLTARRHSRLRTLPASRASSRSMATLAIGRWLRGATSASPVCWSHVRRRFYDRAVAEASPIAHEALQRIAQLYGIEKDIRGRTPDERRAVRQERSHPIVADTRTLAARQARAHQQEEQARRRDTLRARPMGRTLPLPRRRPHRDRLQYRRAFNQAACSQSQKCALRGF